MVFLANSIVAKNILNCLRDVHVVLSFVPLVFHYLYDYTNLLYAVYGYEICFLVSNKSYALCKSKYRVYSVEGLTPVRQFLHASKLLDLAESEIRNHVVIFAVLGPCCKVSYILDSLKHSAILSPDLSSIRIVSKTCVRVNDQHSIAGHLHS